jgi:hypothetical protein
VLVLTLAGLLQLAAAPVVALAGAPLLAQLVGGLAVPLLALALYLSLFPLPPPGDDPGDDGGIGRPAGPGPRGPDIDWDRFEREFWAEVGRHRRERSRTPAPV